MSKINKLVTLLRSDRSIFHTQDLAILWQVTNRQTLYTTIKRYIQKGILFKITKGLYSTRPYKDINKYELGTSLIHKYCYLSLETVLFLEGVINQKVYPITYVSSVSKKIKLGDDYFIYRQMDDKKLYDPNGVMEMNGFFKADRNRAIKDMLYFNPKFNLDNI